MKNRKKDVKLLIIIVFTFTLGIVASGLTISYAATTLSSKNVHYDNTNSGGSSTNVSGAIDELYATADDQDLLTAKIIDKIYPVGSIYISTTDSTVDSVEQRFGGTWVRYATDTTLVGYKEGTNTVNATGGSKTVTLSNINLPNHTHTTPTTNTGGQSASHTHSIPTLTGTAESAGEHAHNQYIYLNQASTATKPANAAYYNFAGGSNTWLYGSTTANNYNRWWIGASNPSGAHTHSISTNTSTTGNDNVDHTHTLPAMTTNSCTNCSSTPVNVQNPYTVVYMYKRTA